MALIEALWLGQIINQSPPTIGITGALCMQADGLETASVMTNDDVPPITMKNGMHKMNP